MAKLVIEVDLDAELNLSDNFHEHVIPYIAEALQSLPNHKAIHLSSVLETNEPLEQGGAKFLLLNRLSVQECETADEAPDTSKARVVVQMLITDSRFIAAASSTKASSRESIEVGHMRVER